MRAIFVLVSFLAVSAWASTTAEVSVKGMVCSFCAQGIEKKFKAESTIESVDVKLENHRVTLVFKDGQSLDDAAIEKILEDAGYAVDKVVRK